MGVGLGTVTGVVVGIDVATAVRFKTVMTGAEDPVVMGVAAAIAADTLTF